jgi:NADPH-dependent curcumin reductase CurA
MSSCDVKQQVFLVRRPDGDLAAHDFELQESPVPVPGDGQFLVRSFYVSLDPAQRLWAKPQDTHIPKVELKHVMRGFTMGEVVESGNSSFRWDPL